MRHYPHHIGDFNNATRHLTRVERSLYRDLIDLYYDTERPLNADTTKLARLVLAHTDEEHQALQVVLEEFFTLDDDGWHNSRCDDEIARYQGQIEQASRAGKASAAKRANRTATDTNNRSTSVKQPFNGGSTDVENPLHQPRTKNQEPEPITPPNGGDARKRVARHPARPDDVSESVWNDFQAIRKAKRAPLTDTALEGIRREAAKAGIGLSDAIAYCCEAGWQGFNASWYAERTARKPLGGNGSEHVTPQALGVSGTQTLANGAALKKRLFGDVNHA